LHNQYIDKLKEACKSMNEAGVAHLDLRPDNIMWRVSKHGKELEMYIIDFDDALLLGDVISSDYVKVIVSTSDYRYPFRAGNENMKIMAGISHNQYFLDALIGWLSSDCQSYSDFINQQRIDLLPVSEIRISSNQQIVDEGTSIANNAGETIQSPGQKSS